MGDAVIVSTARTTIGAPSRSALADVEAPGSGSAPVGEAVRRSGLASPG